MVIAAALAILAMTSSQGQRIHVKDGDTIVTDLGAKLAVVRHAEGQARVVYSADERWVVVLLDHTGPDGTPDGFVDASYFFREVQSWPWSERLDGAASIDEYSTIGDPLVGIGLRTPAGFVQLITRLGPSRGDDFSDASATLVPFSGFGRGVSPRLSFDAAERQQTLSVRRMPPGRTVPPAASYGPVQVPPDAAAMATPAELAPVRVGGNIPQPRKIVDARAVLPAEAKQAGIRGVVILEIVIDVDGSIRDAKVLRSIPTLDRAAIDAVRQWRYEVTQLNGRPVPVIMTATVPFQ
jgi:TonB family protein